jgi:hypothetical protein
VAAAVLRLDELGEAESWTAFAMIGRYNAFRLLKRRALVEDVNQQTRREALEQLADYSADVQGVWARYPTRWRLTDAGRALVAELKRDPRFPPIT